VNTFFQIENKPELMSKTLGQIGVPPLDIVIARSGGEAIGFEMAADRQRVLGPLAVESEALSWE
jgi:hypothetical protein